MSLFIGFGFISVLEIIYFFTVRIYDNMTDPVLIRDKKNKAVESDGDWTQGRDEVISKKYNYF